VSLGGAASGPQKWGTAMDEREALRICVSAHLYLMHNPRYWYDRTLQQADMMLVGAASDLRMEMRKRERAA
jgi:hypothetical protein